MLTPSAIKVITTLDPSTSDFLATHILTEAYFRRLFYLGLRFENFSHHPAQHIASYQFLRTDRLLKALFEMLTKDALWFSKAKQKHKEWAILVDLHDKYTSIYRNRLVHGISTISQDFGRLLCHIDISYVTEFEAVLSSEFGRSAFDEPVKGWKAPDNKKFEDFDKACIRFKGLCDSRGWNPFLGERYVEENFTKDKVLQLLSKTKYKFNQDGEQGDAANP